MAPPLSFRASVTSGNTRSDIFSAATYGPFLSLSK
ncbi:hypothetical protein BXY51_001060 [Actinoplanes cyaneus]|nr:hypothetical protein [Actinoplanes cyaneus]